MSAPAVAQRTHRVCLTHLSAGSAALSSAAARRFAVHQSFRYSRTIGSSGTAVKALAEKGGRRDPGSAWRPPRACAAGLLGRFGLASPPAPSSCAPPSRQHAACGAAHARPGPFLSSQPKRLTWPTTLSHTRSIVASAPPFLVPAAVSPP